ncbi:Hemoglobin subunit alpha-2 [Acipenser ruthenus]|uniref:Hemoglobin subunit alpha-2 n=1 Tax=Acipenser ruthenus TaxID=7906 RepID=A0A662YTP4_ACIRT|nr:Hemoglobin subunit alpha-2 [Acipenser ruthenus]
MYSATEKALIVSIWEKVTPHTEEWGGEALERLFTVFPQTKIYFKHVDTSPGSAAIRSHGDKVMKAIGSTAGDLDNMLTTLSSLSNLHAYNLMVDPVNFKLLSHCILVVLANHLPSEFTPEAHLAFDKFLASVASVLSHKYRLIVVFPQTKIYFSHFADLSPSSPQIKAHGAKVLGAIGEAVSGIDNVSASLSKLSELHAYNLRVDPVNFKLLAHTLLVSLSATLGAEFTPEIHLAWDKFLAIVAAVLSEKYR